MTRSDCQITVSDETLVLDPSGAVWWPGTDTLVVADLHFEKGSAYGRGGQFLPPYDTRTTLRRIREAMAIYRPQRVIALGDSFHDANAAARLDEEECAQLAALTKACDWLWIEGNHDPEPPAWLGGRIAPQAAIGNLTFRHLPFNQPCAGEVAGHLHPAVRVSRNGASIRCRCFLSDGLRLVLPAFGAYTGGLDVRDPAVTCLFNGPFGVYAMGKQRVYAVRGAPQLRRKKNVEPHPRNSAIKTVDTP